MGVSGQSGGGYNINPLDMPMSSGPRDRLVGVSEFGVPVYETATGQRYSVRSGGIPNPAPEPRPKDRGLLSEVRRAARSAPEALRTGELTPQARGLLEGIVEGFTAPGRALAGEPVTLGETFGTALEAFGAGSAVPAPRGAVRSGNVRQGIRAYHGSPHDFDRFSMDAIGTGEGAQAYGHGLYFAQSEDVARGYRDQLSRGYLRTADGANVAEEYGADVADIFERTGGDPQDLKDTVARLRGLVDQNLAEFGVSSVSELKPMFEGDLASTVIEFSDRADRLERLISGGNVEFFDPGRMYEVNINANPDDFLDWDAPLSEQPQNVRDFANARWQQVFGRNPDPTIEGEYIAKMASPQHGIDGREWLNTGPAADQARRLREAGIPGIKYRDAGSRGLLEGGTRNFVVFDENLISIIRKYGIAAVAAGLGLSTQELQAQAAEQGINLQQPQGLLQ